VELATAFGRNYASRSGAGMGALLVSVANVQTPCLFMAVAARLLGCLARAGTKR